MDEPWPYRFAAAVPLSALLGRLQGYKLCPGVQKSASISAHPTQPILFQPPHQSVEAVLAEEGLAPEHQCGHAPVAGGVERCIIRGKHGLEALGIGIHRRLEFVRGYNE